MPTGLVPDALVDTQDIHHHQSQKGRQDNAQRGPTVIQRCNNVTAKKAAT